MNDYGFIHFKIDKFIKDKKISKNKLEKEANLQRTQLNSYVNNKVKRIDLDVLSRICSVLDCNIENIMEYQKTRE